MKYDKILTTTKKTSGKNTCEMIVLHHTGWWTFEWNCSLLSSWNKEVSAHYVVWQLWEICKIWNDSDILWHAWESEWLWRKDINKYSIWIEIVNDWYNFTDIQRSAVEKLIIDIIEKYDIKKENIVRHKDIAPNRKVDIYDTFWNNKFSSYNEYINYIYNKIIIMWVYSKLTWFEIFNQKEEDYNTVATIWDIKDLLEIAVYRYDKAKNENALKLR